MGLNTLSSRQTGFRGQQMKQSAYQLGQNEAAFAASSEEDEPKCLRKLNEPQPFYLWNLQQTQCCFATKLCIATKLWA